MPESDTLSDAAWRERLTRNPVLMIHQKKRAADLEAIKLVQSELGDIVKIVVRSGTDPDEDVLPRLAASADLYRGLDDIKAFIEEISGLPGGSRSPKKNGTVVGARNGHSIHK